MAVRQMGPVPGPRYIITAELAGMTMADGLLTIEVAKAAQAQPVGVEVKSRG
jgi:HSP20 family molecular chaperone IbpA